MLKPICVKCERFYRPKKNGVFFIESYPTKPLAPPGRATPEFWLPYKVWSGDLWHCPDCGHELVVGTGMRAVSEKHMDGFMGWVDRAKWLEVKDC